MAYPNPACVANKLNPRVTIPGFSLSATQAKPNPAPSSSRRHTQHFTKKAAPQTYCLYCFTCSFVLLYSIVVRQMCLLHQVRAPNPQGISVCYRRITRKVPLGISSVVHCGRVRVQCSRGYHHCHAGRHIP